MRGAKFSGRFWVAVGLFVFVLAVGIVGPVVVKTSPGATVGGLYDAPSGFGDLILGTDNAGQSVLSNLVHGVSTSLLVGLLAGAIATGIGVVLGLFSGYVGGWLDDLLMGVTNVALAIPSIVVVILLSVSLQSRGIVVLGLVIGITSWPWTARAVRAQATSVRTREHIDVARMSGAKLPGILIFDVLPYLLSYVVMAFVLQMSGAILTESALSMLGLGPAAPTVSLGTMLYWAQSWGSVRTGAYWAFFPPVIMLTLVAFSLLLLQSSLDEVFNPRLRRGKNRKLRDTPSPATAAGTATDAPAARATTSEVPA